MSISQMRKNVATQPYLDWVHGPSFYTLPCTDGVKFLDLGVLGDFFHAVAAWNRICELFQVGIRENHWDQRICDIVQSFP